MMDPGPEGSPTPLRIFFFSLPPVARQIRKHYWCAYAYGAAEQQMPGTISEANTAKKRDENITLREETN